MPPTPTLREISSSISSGTMHERVDGLLSGNTYISYITGTEHSAFQAYNSENGLIRGGVIKVNTDEGQQTAARQNISYDAALKETVTRTTSSPDLPRWKTIAIPGKAKRRRSISSWRWRIIKPAAACR